MTNAEAIKAIRNMIIAGTVGDTTIEDVGTALRMAVEELQGRKNGKWISEWRETEVTIDENGFTTGSCHCSACGDWLVASDEYPTRGRYCPNCGVKMEVEM